MGVLTNLVIADESEAQAVGKANVPSLQWPGLDAKGIDQVKLSKLICILTGEEWNVELIDEFAQLHEESSEGPWVFMVSPRLIQLLVDLDESAIQLIGQQWAETEEFELDQWEPDTVLSTLRDIRKLACAAHNEKKSVLMWMCL